VSTPETATRVELPDLTGGAGPGPTGDLHLLGDVELTVTVELGRVRLPLRELLQLQEGTVVELDRLAGAPVDVLANGTPVARGDVVVVGDELGVRISELLGRVPS
jgi:flagellar motor switch protein FliN/FliY